MLPRSAVNDIEHGDLVDTEIAGNVELPFTIGVALSDDGDEIRRKDRPPVVHTTRGCFRMSDAAVSFTASDLVWWVRGSFLPVLGDHICRVIGSGAEEQVIWTHARSNIAGMADLQAIGDRPVVDLPGDAMDSQITFCAARTDGDVAIAA